MRERNHQPVLVQGHVATPSSPLLTVPVEPGIRPARPANFQAKTPFGVSSLEISSTASTRKQTFFLNKPLISVGRAPSNDIVINEPVISQFHLQLVREGHQYVLIHPHPLQPKTLNGLIYQGRFIEGNQPFRRPLINGDVCHIGYLRIMQVTLFFHDGSDALIETRVDSSPVALGAALITFGRCPDNIVVLDHCHVSSHHARLERVGNNYYLVDLHSTNHVYVNNQPIGTRLLVPGDEMRIGPFRMLFTPTELRRLN